MQRFALSMATVAMLGFGFAGTANAADEGAATGTDTGAATTAPAAPKHKACGKRRACHRHKAKAKAAAPATTTDSTAK